MANIFSTTKKDRRAQPINQLKRAAKDFQHHLISRINDDYVTMLHPNFFDTNFFRLIDLTGTTYPTVIGITGDITEGMFGTFLMPGKIFIVVGAPFGSLAPLARLAALPAAVYLPSVLISSFIAFEYRGGDPAWKMLRLSIIPYDDSDQESDSEVVETIELSRGPREFREIAYHASELVSKHMSPLFEMMERILSRALDPWKIDIWEERLKKFR